MTHFRIYLYKQMSNAGQAFSTFLIYSNKTCGSDNSLVSFLLASEVGES